MRLAGEGLIVATALESSACLMAVGPVMAAGTRAFVCTLSAMPGGTAPRS